MSKKLYLDGCSFTYGVNLKKEEKLEHLFIESGYDVTNFSRPGKSNMAIAIDTFNNFVNHDVIVIGWTFSSRFYLKYLEQHIDLIPTRPNIEVENVLNADAIEQSYSDLYKHFYSLHDTDYFRNLSDMLVTQTYCQLHNSGKKIVFFSWEKRTLDKIFYPHVAGNHRLPCGHLNNNGTNYLCNTIQQLLNE